MTIFARAGIQPAEYAARMQAYLSRPANFAHPVKKYMPPEWENHSQCWTAWPCSQWWRDGGKSAQQAVVNMAKAISQFEPVTVLAPAEAWMDAREQLPSQIRVLELLTDDIWLRDCGPTYVAAQATADSPQQLMGISWSYNGYGGKFEKLHDTLAAAKICGVARVPCIRSPLCLEGGAIHADGEGTLLATETSILNSNRNPGWSREQVEQQLKQDLGVTRCIWLKQGMYQDNDTDGHIDNLCCFARPGVVLLAWTDDKSDPQYEISAQALETLEAAVDARGRRLTVVRLPLPPPQYRTKEEVDGIGVPGQTYRHAGERMMASYNNFYLANGGLVMPSFGVPEADARAQSVLQEWFPDRRVVAVPAREIVLGGGGIHCITQQQPVVLGL